MPSRPPNIMYLLHKLLNLKEDCNVAICTMTREELAEHGYELAEILNRKFPTSKSYIIGVCLGQ